MYQCLSVLRFWGALKNIDMKTEKWRWSFSNLFNKDKQDRARIDVAAWATQHGPNLKHLWFCLFTRSALPKEPNLRDQVRYYLWFYFIQWIWKCALLSSLVNFKEPLWERTKVNQCLKEPKWRRLVFILAEFWKGWFFSPMFIIYTYSKTQKQFYFISINLTENLKVFKSLFCSQFIYLWLPAVFIQFITF